MIGDFRSLKVVNDYLYAEGNNRIHMIIEMGAGEVPLPVMGVFQTGNLLVYNGPITRIMSNKLNLAVLSEHEDDPGIYTSPREWVQVLEKALRENNWVLQEYIPSFPYLFQIGENSCAPHQAIWGFLFLVPGMPGDT